MLDGFRGVRGVDRDPQRARQFLYDVGTTLSLQGATTVITGEADSRDPAFYPELTIADVIIGLHFTLEDVRHERGLEAIKIRGGAPLPGLHSFVLDAAGTTVYPRLAVRALSGVGAPSAERDRLKISGRPARVAFDLPELDALLIGGLTRRSSTLLAGSLGVGKTHLAVHFALAGVRAGEAVVFLGFRETEEQLQYRAEPMAVPAENVLLLQQIAEHGRLRRMLAVVKTRFSAHTAGLGEFVGTEAHGVTVLPAGEEKANRDPGSPPSAALGH